MKIILIRRIKRMNFKKLLGIVLLMFIAVGMMFSPALNVRAEDEEETTETEEVYAEAAPAEAKETPADEKADDEGGAKIPPVYTFIDEVSFTINPPADGEEVVVVWDGTTLVSQTTHPSVTVTGDNSVSNIDPTDNKDMAYWINYASLEFAEDLFYEGTYACDDTFYAVVGFVCPPSYTAMYSGITYVFEWADTVNVQVEGAELVSQTIDGDYLTICVKGTIDCGVGPDTPTPDEPTPVDPTPAVSPATLPKTGIESNMPLMIAVVSMLCIAGAAVIISRQKHQ